MDALPITGLDPADVIAWHVERADVTAVAHRLRLTRTRLKIRAAANAREHDAAVKAHMRAAAAA